MIRNLSHGAQEFFQKMETQEMESFINHVTGIGMRMQPFKGGDLEVIIDSIVSEEAEKLYKESPAFKNMMEMREKFNADFESRLKTGGPSEESIDPSEELLKLTRRLMVEKGLDYSSALNLAQTTRRDLAEAILKKLDESRGKE